MSASPGKSSAAERKYESLLRVSQAANAELEISAVLGAVFRVLQPLVAIDMVAVAAIEGDLLNPRTPLFVRERLIASMTFSRMAVQSFTADEVAILEDVSPPIALAVGNSFAYEEIRRLKDQLQAENLVLRSKNMGKADAAETQAIAKAPASTFPPSDYYKQTAGAVN